MKKKTVAALTFYSDDGVTLTLSTTGTKAAPGARIIRWSIDWGDETIDITESSLPQLVNHRHTKSGNYEIILSVEDNKGARAEDRTTVFVAREEPTTLPPIITSLNPDSGPVGSEVTINGSGFGSVQGTTTLTFENIPAPVVSWSDTKIVCKIP